MGYFYESMTVLSYFCHQLSQKWVNVDDKIYVFQALYGSFSFSNIDFAVDRGILPAFYFDCDGKGSFELLGVLFLGMGVEIYLKLCWKWYTVTVIPKFLCVPVTVFLAY